MGGAVSVTIRLSENEIHKMEWYTGGLPILLETEFLDQDPSFLEEKRIKWSKPALQGVLAPVEYGLVVVDFVSKRIIGCQGYTRLSRRAISSVIYYDEFENISKLIDSGRITKVGYPLPNHVRVPDCAQHAANIIPISFYGKNNTEIFAKLKNLHDEASRSDDITDRLRSWGYFIIDHRPITNIIDYDDLGTDEWKKFKNVLTEEMKFLLSPEDEVGWDHWFHYLKEIEEDNAESDSSSTT